MRLKTDVFCFSYRYSMQDLPRKCRSKCVLYVVLSIIKYLIIKNSLVLGNLFRSVGAQPAQCPY